MSLCLRRWIPGLLAGAIVVASCGVALAQDKDPANGTWKLNAGEVEVQPRSGPEGNDADH